MSWLLPKAGYHAGERLSGSGSAHATEQDRPDALKRHKEWFESQLDLDPDKLVFIDET